MTGEIKCTIRAEGINWVVNAKHVKTPNALYSIISPIPEAGAFHCATWVWSGIQTDIGSAWKNVSLFIIRMGAEHWGSRDDSTKQQKSWTGQAHILDGLLCNVNCIRLFAAMITFQSCPVCEYYETLCSVLPPDKPINAKICNFNFSSWIAFHCLTVASNNTAPHTVNTGLFWSEHSLSLDKTKVKISVWSFWKTMSG